MSIQNDKQLDDLMLVLNRQADSLEMLVNMKLVPPPSQFGWWLRDAKDSFLQIMGFKSGG